MASSITKPGKQLGELLLKEQDPFVLDVFLNERSYGNRNTSDSNKTRKRRNGIPSCSRVLRAILGKFGFNKSDGSQNTTASDDQIQGKFNEKLKKNLFLQNVSEPDRFSSASCRTVYNSCSDSDYSQDESSTSLDKNEHESFEATRLGYKAEKEPAQAISGGTFAFRQLIGSNKRSSVSIVKEETPLSQERINLIITRQSLETKTKISSLLMESEITEKPRKFSTKISDPNKGLLNLKTKPSTQFLKSKRVLSKTKQLLFDCVREIVETHAKEKEKVDYGTKGVVLGPEELGELLWEKMKVWSKQSSVDDTNNITYLLCLDLVDTAQEWNGFDSENKEICWEIGDAIVEEIMNEFVIETMS
ncbi:hypothetical protein CsatB_007812 [Cannabis sativa]